MNKIFLFILIFVKLTVSGCVIPSTSKDLKNQHSGKKEIIKNNYEEIKPWEGFRGWSPRQPYGQDSKNTIRKFESEKGKEHDFP